LLIKTWDVQEFSYLSEEKYKNTSPNDRKNAREEFWEKANLSFRSDKSSESVCDLIERAQKTIDSIYDLFSPVYPNASDRIYIFSHGQFIKTIMLLLHKENMSDKRGIEMSELRNYFNLIETPNTGIIKIKFDPLQGGKTWLSSDIGAESVKESLI
jgi:broad specificity phosphatase PhoE